MTIPGGAGTYPMRKRSFLRARRTGFYQGSELSRYGAPALRFAPSRCPKFSSAPVPAAAHNPQRYAYSLAGGPSRSGRGYGSLSMRIQLPAADMFSLSLQVVGKNVSSSQRASEKGVTQKKI
jgi:hypothetical protein